MATYIVMEPPAIDQDDATDRARMIRDGFSFPAFVFAPLWLLWHRMWIEAALVFAAGLIIAEAAERAGLGAAGSLVSLILSLFIALEGQRLYAWALRRRGWDYWGVVDAGSAVDAEARYAYIVAGEDDPDLAVTSAPSAITAEVSSRGSMPGPALGLLSYPGRT